MKVFYGLLLLFLLIAGVSLYYYHVVLPENISNALLGEGGDKPIPQKIIEKGKSLGLEVENKPEEIIRKLGENNTNIEELKEFVETVELEQVEKFLEEASQTGIDSSEIAFHFLKDNIDFGDFPIDSFENEFHRYFDQKKFEKAMKFYEENKNQMPVIYPVLKEAIIKYLEKIESEAEVDSLETDGK